MTKQKCNMCELILPTCDELFNECQRYMDKVPLSDHEIKKLDIWIENNKRDYKRYQNEGLREFSRCMKDDIHRSKWEEFIEKNKGAF